MHKPTRPGGYRRGHFGGLPVMPLLRKFERVFVALNGWVVILCLVAMSGVVFTNVGLRYLTGPSIPWADEVARYLMIWCCATAGMWQSAICTMSCRCRCGAR